MSQFCLAKSCSAAVQMATLLLAEKLKAWRGRLSLKEAAAKLDIDYPTYRKYESGKRTPCKLALAELQRRLDNLSSLPGGNGDAQASAGGLQPGRKNTDQVQHRSSVGHSRQDDRGRTRG